METISLMPVEYIANTVRSLQSQNWENLTEAQLAAISLFMVRADILVEPIKLGNYYAGFDSQVNDSWIVILDCDGNLIEALKLPLIKVAKYGNNVISIKDVVRSLARYENIIILAEQIKGFNQGSKASMTFGSALNLIGQLQAEPHISLSLLYPQQWKGSWGLTSDKSLSIALAKDKGLVFDCKPGKESSNLAESYLLAKFVYEASQTPLAHLI